MSPKTRKLLAALAALAAAVIALIAVIDGGDDGGPPGGPPAATASPTASPSPSPSPSPTATPYTDTERLPGGDVKIDPGGPVAPVVVDPDQRLEPGEQDDASDLTGQAGEPELHQDMRDETPPGVPEAKIEAGAEKTEDLADRVLADPKPPAGAQAYSCPRRPIVNYSSLSGPRVGSALHFTVSSPGSMNAIINLFNTPSFGASSNKIIELTGQCRTLVPNGLKAWAQGAANSAYISTEIVTNDLTAAQWRAAPIIKNGTLAAIVRDDNRSIGAPLKKVDPVGCVWTPGIVDHDALECGNTHWDVGRNFPWILFIRQVQLGTRTPITHKDRRRCHKIHAYRARPAAGRARGAERRQQLRLDTNRRLELDCKTGKVVRA